MFPLFFFHFHTPLGWWFLAKVRGAEITTRKKTFEGLVGSAKGEVVLPKGSPRNVTFWSFRRSA